MSKRPAHSPEAPPWRMLLWTALAGLIFGLIGFGEILEDDLRVARNNFHRHPASGELVIVTIDDRSLRQYGNWPWPRRFHALLIDKLRESGVTKIFFDINFSYPSSTTDDRAMAEALRKSGNVTLAARFRAGPSHGKLIEGQPLPQFVRFARQASLSVEYNYQNAVWRLPYAVDIAGHAVPSFAAALANKAGPTSEKFFVDYALDVHTLPTISAGDVMSGRVPVRSLAGKTILIGTDSDVVGDRYFIPGYGRAGGVFVHALGAETLKSGKPVDVGWVPGFLLALAVVGLTVRLTSLAQRNVAMTLGASALLVVPVVLEAHLIFADITPGLFVLLTVACNQLWRRYRLRGLVNPVSSLPNLSALRSNVDGRKQAMVAARLLNYEGILATLPPNSEKQLVEQIIARLTVGHAGRTLYQGDGGIFAWFEPTKQPFGNHLDALYALFRNPARVAGRPIDLTVAFGVEAGSGRSLANRLASALVAADEAAHDGLKWKYHDPETLEDASWKLSMLSQLDDAIDRGEVWVAYQPKLELATKRIIGAEALARWTHPEKGPIAASEFVAAAEAHDRIGKLTDFVLGKAVAAAAAINRGGTPFDMAVNLSARLLVDKGFTLRLSALLARHGLAPQHLTLELTETAALAGNGEGLDMITRLRDFGVRIAIDDYGTGLSTLDYLKKIPANEIKIDQSFVKGVCDNRSDRLMVQSTIGLAHSLGRQVVAEGVEQQAVLDLLVEMGCDIAQGFAIGRPMSLDSLGKRLAAGRKRSAA